jgi:hypothetical protein
MGEAKKIAKAATKAAETARRKQDMLDKRQTIESDELFALKADAADLAALDLRVDATETDITALEAADIALDGRLDTVETALPLKLQWTTVPASAAATGTAGQIAFEAGWFYVCVATNTWERAAIATWV